MIRPLGIFSQRRCKTYSVCKICSAAVGFHCVVFPEYCTDRKGCQDRWLLGGQPNV